MTTWSFPTTTVVPDNTGAFQVVFWHDGAGVQHYRTPIVAWSASGVSGASRPIHAGYDRIPSSEVTCIEFRDRGEPYAWEFHDLRVHTFSEAEAHARKRIAKHLEHEEWKRQHAAAGGSA